MRLTVTLDKDVHDTLDAKSGRKKEFSSISHAINRIVSDKYGLGEKKRQEPPAQEQAPASEGSTQS